MHPFPTIYPKFLPHNPSLIRHPFIFLSHRINKSFVHPREKSDRNHCARMFALSVNKTSAECQGGQIKRKTKLDDFAVSASETKFLDDNFCLIFLEAWGFTWLPLITTSTINSMDRPFPVKFVVFILSSGCKGVGRYQLRVLLSCATCRATVT